MESWCSSNASPAEMQLCNESVLVLSSRSEGFRTMAHVCMDLGLRCDVAPTVEQALPRLAHHRYPCVVADMEGPSIQEILGIARLLWARQPSARLAVMTASSALRDAAPLIGSGIVDFLHPPLARDEVTCILGLIVQQVRLHREAAGSVAALVESVRRELRQAPVQAAYRLREVRCLHGECAVAHNMEGLLHEMYERPSEGQQSYEAALRLDATYTPARMNMRRLRAAGRDR